MAAAYGQSHRAPATFLAWLPETYFPFLNGLLPFNGQGRNLNIRLTHDKKFR